MPRKFKSNEPKQRQISAFRKAARALGCEESQERFESVLRAIGKSKPKHPERTTETKKPG